jgi:opacity protein-like surface antigen
MKYLSLLALLLALSMSCAYAENGPYIGGTVSYTVLSKSDVTDPSLPGETVILEYNQGAAFALNAGYRFGYLRLEGELAYQRNGIDAYGGASSGDATGELTQTTALLNGYFDIPVKGESVKPYVGIGGGSSKVKLGDFNTAGSGLPNSSGDDTANVFQLSVGALFPVDEHLSVDTRYRYQGFSDAEFDGTKFTLSGYQLSLGLQYSF